VLNLRDLRIRRGKAKPALIVLAVKSLVAWLCYFRSLQRSPEKSSISDSFYFSFDSLGLVKVIGLNCQLL